MFLRRIDLLSGGPQVSIFNQGSNKTLFGGILSLIYLIIFLLIAIAYLADYSINDKYNVQYGIDQKERFENLEELSEDINLCPNIYYMFRLYNYNNYTELSDRFVIIDTEDKIINRNKVLSNQVSKLNFGIFYKCDNISCLLNEEDKANYGYLFILQYQGFELDHQGDVPLHKANKDYYIDSDFFFNKPALQYLHWGIIKYSEERYFLSVLYNLFGGEDEELIGGYFKGVSNFFLDGILEEKKCIEFINGTYYKLLGVFTGRVDFNRYETYKRTKVFILDVFANISALSMTVLDFFGFFFSNYYSNNFDNYKIIEKVLSKEKKYRKYVNKDISEDITEDKNKQIELIDNYGKTESLITNENNIEVKEDKIIEEKKDEDEIDERAIPKLRFIDFIINSFYNDNLCKPSNRQQIISCCNDLVSKYYTIEDIIYNQIKLDNLLKDYKWNDPKLKYIENNEFVVELKSYYKI